MFELGILDHKQNEWLRTIDKDIKGILFSFPSGIKGNIEYLKAGKVNGLNYQKVREVGGLKYGKNRTLYLKYMWLLKKIVNKKLILAGYESHT